MRILMVLPCTIALAVALLAQGDAARAQQSTTATYSDWVLQCATTGAPAKKICAIAQVTQVQGKNIPFSRVSILTPTKGQPPKLNIQVPVNVSLRSPLALQMGDKAPKLSTPFDTCAPGGCFATFDLKDDVLKKLSSSDETMKISFKDAGGHDVTFPLSLKGFQASFDALLKD